jgi:transcriptional regulator GlxA family with amidase domain
MSKTRNVAIFIFDDVEILDFAGPYEVFNVTTETSQGNPFYVYSVGLTGEVVQARGKLALQPAFSIDNCPQPDLLLIPGGWGTRALLKNERVMDWLRDQTPKVEFLLSVCTGALLLAQAGLLKGLNATTHAGAFGELAAISSDITILKEERWVDNGKIITSGGVSAGIDMALYVVHKLLGDDALAATLNEMEYSWRS